MLPIRSWFNAAVNLLPSSWTGAPAKKPNAPPLDAIESMARSFAKVTQPKASRAEINARVSDAMGKFAADMTRLSFSKACQKVLADAEKEKEAGPLSPDTVRQLDKISKTALASTQMSMEQGLFAFVAEMVTVYHRSKELLAEPIPPADATRIQGLVTSSLESYATALTNVDVKGGFDSLHIYRAAKRAQGAKIDEDDLGGMRSELFARRITQQAHKLIAPPAGEKPLSPHDPRSPIEEISSLLRMRPSAGVTLGASSLKLAAQAWAVFSAGEKRNLDRSDAPYGTMSYAELAADDFKAWWKAHANHLDAGDKFESLGFTPETLPPEAKKVFASLHAVEIDVRLSRVRTVIYDNNPFNAADGLARLAVVEGIAADAARWKLDLKDEHYAGDLAKIPEWKQTFATWQREAAELEAKG